jgi:hypothetical protein
MNLLKLIGRSLVDLTVPARNTLKTINAKQNHKHPQRATLRRTGLRPDGDAPFKPYTQVGDAPKGVHPVGIPAKEGAGFESTAVYPQQPTCAQVAPPAPGHCPLIDGAVLATGRSGAPGARGTPPSRRRLNGRSPGRNSRDPPQYQSHTHTAPGTGSPAPPPRGGRRAREGGAKRRGVGSAVRT